MKVLAYRLFALLVLSAVYHPFAQEPVQDASRQSSDEVEELIEKLNTVPEAPLRFENLADAPLKITAATMRTTERGQSGNPSPLLRGKYVLIEKVTLVNKTGRPIANVTLQFTNFSDRQERIHSGDITIQPNSSVVFGPHRKGKPDLVSTATDPRHLTVKLFEVRFGDGSIWAIDASIQEQLEVDVWPILLNKPRPKYSEEARRNRIQGAVRVALLVDEYGKVKRVRIVRGLPDGLNQEAVVAASDLKFKPAMKERQPVEYWLLFEIDFNLPVKRN